MQEYIVSKVQHFSGKAIPAPYMARQYARYLYLQSPNALTPHLRASVRRAIERLEARGGVSTRQLELPTAQGGRWTLCVAAPGTDWNDPKVYESAIRWAIREENHRTGHKMNPESFARRWLARRAI